MVTLSSCFKKVSLSVIFLIFSAIWIHTNAQQTSPVNFKYKVDSLKVGEQYQYTISVMVTSGEGPFLIGVYENLREDLKELDKKENVVSNEAKLTFTGRKSCIIFVRNNSQSAIKTLIYN